MQVPDIDSSLQSELELDGKRADRALRILEARLDAYGHFRDFTLEPVDPRITLFFGANESGKSTLFSFFYAMMFGLYPTSPETHPYYPLDARHLQGSLMYRVDGKEMTVERKMMSGITSTLYVDGTSRQLKNRNLPEVEFLSKEVFASVFALDLSALVAPAGSDAWKDIQKRLLGGMGADFLRPGREVADDLEKEAGRFWMPSRHRHPRAAAIEARLSEIRGEKREARERAQRIRTMTSERRELTEELRKLEQEEQRLGERHRRMRRLRPLHRTLRAIEIGRDEAGDIERFAALPVDPIDERRRLKETLEELQIDRRKRSTEIARLEAVVASVRDRDEEMAAMASTIRGLDRLRGEVAQLIEQLSNVEERCSDLEKRLDVDGARLFVEGWSNDISQKLESVSLAECEAAVARLSEARRRLDEGRIKHEAYESSRPVERADRVWLAASAGCAVVAAIGVIAGFGAGVGVALTGAVLAAAMYIAARTYNAGLREKQPPIDLPALARDADAARARLRQLLKGLPVPPARIERGDSELVTALERITRLSADLDAAVALRNQIATRIDDARRRVADVSGALDIEEADLDVAVEFMLEQLDAARERISRAGEAKERLALLSQEMDETDRRHAAASDALDEMVRQVEQLGGGDFAAGAEVLVRRREALREVRQAEQQLRSAGLVLDDVRLEIKQAMESDAALFDEGEEERLDAAREKLAASIRGTDAKLAALKAEIERLEDDATLDELESEEMQLNEQLAGVKRERDRLMLLASIIRRTDEAFRQKHQPDVIKRASGYLHDLTLGRYDGLMLEEEKLFAIPSGDHRPRLVRDSEYNWTSRGTRDQIFLAIRMALMDHLDEHQVRLPVFLDETFVNWDEQRRAAGLRMLDKLAGHRQVFLFTCHEWFRDDVRAALSPTVINL